MKSGAASSLCRVVRACHSSLPADAVNAVLSIVAVEINAA